MYEVQKTVILNVEAIRFTDIILNILLSYYYSVQGGICSIIRCGIASSYL
jgi:hypothetical protein